MKKNNKYGKFDNEIIVCIGADIPPISSRQFMIWGAIEELQNKSGNVPLTTTLDIIFEDYTFSKKRRFEIISSLVKDKLISRKRVTEKLYTYFIITKIPLRKCKEVRKYQCLSNKDIWKVKKRFMLLN